jgi:hypothetical protein
MARKKKNGALTLTRAQRRNGKQYKNVIASVGMSQVRAAKFLDVNERTSRRYASGEWPLPRAHRLLLAVLVHKRVSPDRAEALLAAMWP